MIAFACMLLLAATTRVDLADEDYQIPAGDWKWIEVDLRQQPAEVIANYAVMSGSEKVRIALITRDDLDNLQEKELITATPRGRAGAFAYRVPNRDSYAILVDNRADKEHAAVVRLHVSLDFARTTALQLSRERRVTVVAISFLAFFAVVTYSARKLLKVAGRPGGLPH
ncbi:MAG TPA: hypothetical protein VMJ75_27160 [Candidatus Acidoferrales bacterium]|nr:hypothetical protein [Candidatus Acidoferrales bacterium]